MEGMNIALTCVLQVAGFTGARTGTSHHNNCSYMNVISSCEAIESTMYVDTFSGM